MSRFLLLSVLFSMLTVIGCSTRSAYEGMRYSKELECRKLPSSEYEDCMRTLEKDYDRYREQREDVVKDRY